jgi:hypothetical protein
MITYNGVRNKESEILINKIKKIDFGLMILDEVKLF